MSGAASGVAVEDGCVQAFLDIKRKRAHRFVLYRIGAQWRAQCSASAGAWERACVLRCCAARRVR
jgi:hypothetical protein